MDPGLRWDDRKTGNMDYPAPTPCDLLIEAGWVVPVEPHGVVLSDHAVAVSGGRIVAILPNDQARSRVLPKQIDSSTETILLT